MAVRFSETWSRLKQNHFFRWGLPFLIFVVGSSFAMTEFTSIRYEKRRSRQLAEKAQTLAEQLRDVKDGQLNDMSLEEHYEKTIRELDLDDYENVRGPRPWEPETLLYVKKVKDQKVEALQARRKKLEEQDASK